MIASDVTSLAAKAYLNDSAQATFTDAVLLPCLEVAVLNLENEFRVNGIAFEKRISIDISVTSDSSTELPEYPVDFIEPIKLYERDAGSDDKWILMNEEEWEPDVTPGSLLVYWAFRNGLIYFPGCTTDRDVRLYYKGTLTKPTTASSVIDIIESKGYLAVRTAQVAMKNIANNSTRAVELEVDVQEEKDLLLRAMINNGQQVASGRKRSYKGRR